MINAALTSFFDENPDIASANVLAIGVSGGPDSMALAHALLSQYPDMEFHLLSVDHGLRDAAAREIALVRDLAAGFDNANFAAFKWEGEKPQTRILEAARTARYALMSEYMAAYKIAHLFLAHHQDDQGETFLIRLAKGSGIDGLGGMAARSTQNFTGHDVTLLRPLLEVPKAGLLNYCAVKNIKYASDPTNENADYLRPRLRTAQEVLAAEGLDAKRLSKMAARMARASEALEVMSDEVYANAVQTDEKGAHSVDVKILFEAPLEISFRVLKRVIDGLESDAAYGVRYSKIEKLHDDILTAYNQKQSVKKRSIGQGFIAYDAGKHQILVMDK